MHGRLKVKTTEQQEQERKKEKDAKQTKYTAAFSIILSKRLENACDNSTLEICAQLLLVNPDALSLWNYRREIIQTLRKSEDRNYIDKLEESELGVTEYCLMKNHKSYGAWHHRQWILSTSLNKYWDKEMDVCDQYLSKDDRNFHCWDHRRIVAVESNRTVKDELKYTQKLIEENMSNYSAWHYRSKLLPIVYPSGDECAHPIPEEIFIQELNRVISAIFTDPNDQSPWFFLRWLLAHESNAKNIVQLGLLNEEKGERVNLVVVFNSAIDSIETFGIRVGNLENKSALKWHCDSTRCVWSCEITSSEALNGMDVYHGEVDFPVHLLLKSIEDKCSVSEWLVENVNIVPVLSDAKRKSLNELLENCRLLDSVDPGNKWVLLTMVDVMSSLDSSKFLPQILETLDHLSKIDCLRDNYYRDIGSKLQMEVSLEEYVKTGQNSFSLSNCQLSRVVKSHLLCFATRVDLSRNNIRSLKPLNVLYNCRELILDGNHIEDLEPLEDLSNLESISIENCTTSSEDQFRVLDRLRERHRVIKGDLKVL